MNVPFVDLKTQYLSLREEMDAALDGVLSRCDFILGKAVPELESRFAEYCEVPFAVAVDSGFSALELALRALGIGPGDEVITAANTFIATALAISACGARPVLADVDPETYTLDPEKVSRAITPATRAILPVHLFGQPADMDPLLEIAREHRLRVIEDACQAHGARYKGRRVGSLGDAAAFSFYPSKNLGAYGDGGAVTLHDSIAAERIRWMRNVGQLAKNLHSIKGFNHRLDTLQAAVLLVKLPHLDEWNASRRRAAGLYRKMLANLPVGLPYAAPYGEHVYHLFVIRAPERDALQEQLNQAGIGTGVHYPRPIHLQPAYMELGYKLGDFPVAEQAANEMLSLPMFPELSGEQIACVAWEIGKHIQERLPLAE